MVRDVFISEINPTRIRYNCPFCSKTHTHSNETGDIKMGLGWQTHRMSHCLKNDESVNLIVNQSTVKIPLGR